VAAFVADRDPKAYEHLVDRLLDSPQYGERWGRHWLDVAGFAESSMFIGDVPRQGFWRYRDYVIRAFNADKPYNEFVLEQLAGDELFNWRDAGEFTEAQQELLIATGFLRCPPDATDNQAITQMDKRFATQQAAVEVSMKALLGLTLNCVRCHDHKFDPILQKEYYAMAAVFQPAYDPERWLPGIWSATTVGSLRAIPLLPPEERRHVMSESRGWFEEHRAISQQARGGLEREYRDRWFRQHADALTNAASRERIRSAMATPPENRDDAAEKCLATEAEQMGLNAARLRELYPEFADRHAQLTNQVEALRQKSAQFKEGVLWCTFDSSTEPTPTRVLKRGNYETPGDVVAPGVIAVLNQGRPAVDFSHAPGAWTTGRRLALARWLTSREHPLLARVMVNRIWQYHFGTGLVSTPDDFGARGSRPVNQALLDWLAAEFMEQNWSVKHLHRLILASATYRQRTVGSSTQAKSPGDGVWPAAFSPGPRRLEAEAIRDGMLAVSGLLDRRFFGPSVPTERRSDGSFAIKAGHAERYRRSIYLHTRRTYVPTFLTIFDAPQMDTNWPKRSNSAIAQQALALMNDEFVIECARALAERVQREGGGKFRSRLGRAFALVYNRQPSSAEIRLFEKAAEQGGEKDPWPILCQSLLSSSEFLYAD
jgi:hypothetical protein